MRSNGPDEARPRCVVAVAADVLRWWGDALGRRDSDALNPGEAERWSRLRRQQDRDGFVAARILLRWLLIEESVALDEVELRQVCATCGGPHGRPEVVGRPDLAVSFAHSGGLVAAAVGAGPPGVSPLGVDVERVMRARPADSLPLGWPEWTRAEALIKAGVLTLDDAVDGAVPPAEAFGLITTALAGDTSLGPYVGAVAAPTVAIQREFGEPATTDRLRCSPERQADARADDDQD